MRYGKYDKDQNSGDANEEQVTIHQVILFPVIFPQDDKRRNKKRPGSYSPDYIVQYANGCQMPQDPVSRENPGPHLFSYCV